MTFPASTRTTRKSRRSCATLFPTPSSSRRRGPSASPPAGAGEDAVTFSVADTGIGIGKEHHAAIFQDFIQVDSPLQRKWRGTGLGLSLSKKIAELLGGSVAMTSEPGVGSTFSVTVPIQYGKAEEAQGMRGEFMSNKFPRSSSSMTIRPRCTQHPACFAASAGRSWKPRPARRPSQRPAAPTS